jgi:hypothetical protein
VIDGTLLATAHGDDERVPVAELEPGLRRLLGAVLDVSMASGPRARPNVEQAR